MRNRACDWKNIIGVACLTALLVWAVIPVERAVANDPAGDVPENGDIYYFIGEQAAWLGTHIRYTVPETARVEARFLSPSGEIIVLMQLGEQSPGQYTLEWYKEHLGSQMAGVYGFEMYFDDEYAVRTRVAIMPKLR